MGSPEEDVDHVETDCDIRGPGDLPLLRGGLAALSGAGRRRADPCWPDTRKDRLTGRKSRQETGRRPPLPFPASRVNVPVVTPTAQSDPAVCAAVIKYAQGSAVVQPGETHVEQEPSTSRPRSAASGAPGRSDVAVGR